MTKTTTITLLAALSLATGGAAHADTPRTLGNGRPACGNTMGGKGGHRDDACTRAVEHTVDATRQIERSGLAGPRSAAEGGRGGSIERRAIATLAREVTTMFVASPIALVTVRLLDSGRPACGNTMTKNDDCATSTTTTTVERT